MNSSICRTLPTNQPTAAFLPCVTPFLTLAPLERIIAAKWVRKQTRTGNVSSNGHLALPELIWRLVRRAYACVHAHRNTLRDKHTHTHTLAALCGPAVPLLIGNQTSQVLHASGSDRLRCNRNPSLWMDSFASFLACEHTLMHHSAVILLHGELIIVILHNAATRNGHFVFYYYFYGHWQTDWSN